MKNIPRNKLSVITNPYQSNHLKALTVCSGGVLRSPTTATLLSQLYNYNTRSCGTEDYALVPLSKELVAWADIVICAEHYHYGEVMNVMDNVYLETEARPLIYVLEVPDEYDYMHPELVELVKAKFEEWKFT